MRSKGNFCTETAVVSARRFIVLCSDEGKKASVKLAEIVIYWERKFPTLL